MDKQHFEIFISELGVRLDSARELERQLDQVLAHRFNVFNYVLSHETQLSKLIAVLLDPHAKHGQGNLFLRKFLDLLRRTNGLAEKVKSILRKLEDSKVSVITEKSTKNNRSIDIFLEMNHANELFCIAIENKPWATDSDFQVKDHLDFLQNTYDDRFILIYLSGDGSPPAENSVKFDFVEQIGIRNFAIQSYLQYQGNHDEKYDQFRIQDPFVDWLVNCQTVCDVDRLCSFLRDFENYCRQRPEFGGSPVTTEIKKYVSNFLLSKPSNLEYASAVYKSWPLVQDEIFKHFLETLCTQIMRNDKLKDQRDYIECEYKAEYKPKSYRKGQSYIELHIDSWRTCNEEKISIRLESYTSGTDNWWVGVHYPCENGYQEALKRLRSKFSSKRFKYNDYSNDYSEYGPFPCWKNLDRHKVWSGCEPKLHSEYDTKRGEFMNYYIKEFTEFAEKAIPVIDEIESTINNPAMK